MNRAVRQLFVALTTAILASAAPAAGEVPSAPDSASAPDAADPLNLKPRMDPAHPISVEKPGPASRWSLRGTIAMTFVVRADGTVDADTITVEESTGHDQLDETVLDAVPGWRFLPGTENGQPVAKRHSYRVVFEGERDMSPFGKWPLTSNPSMLKLPVPFADDRRDAAPAGDASVQTGTLDGVSYSIQADGSATFEQSGKAPWRVECGSNMYQQIICSARASVLEFSLMRGGIWILNIEVQDKTDCLVAWVPRDPAKPILATIVNPPRQQLKYGDKELKHITRLGESEGIITPCKGRGQDSRDAAMPLTDFTPVKRYVEWAVVAGKPASK